MRVVINYITLMVLVAASGCDKNNFSSGTTNKGNLRGDGPAAGNPNDPDGNGIPGRQDPNDPDGNGIPGLQDPNDPDGDGIPGTSNNGGGPNGSNGGLGNGDGSINGANGGLNSTAGCATNAGVANPNETAYFGSFGQIRDYINSLGKYPQISSIYDSAGAILNDPETARKVCQLKGYSEVVSASQGKFHSCNDNSIAVWDPAGKTFSSKNACSDNRRIDSMTCKGKLKKVCIDNNQWIFQ